MTDASHGTSSGQGFIPATPAPQQPPPPAIRPADDAAQAQHTAAHAASPNPFSDQLARIEDKCSRIEDKYARSEALLSRVEDKVESATGRMGEAARQSDLAALRSEVRGLSERARRLPGTGAWVLTAVITAVLTVVLMIAVQRLNLDGLIAPRANASATR